MRLYFYFITLVASHKTVFIDLVGKEVVTKAINEIN